MKIDLRSSHNPAACAQRLNQAKGDRWATGPRGSASEKSARLYWYRPMVRNSFAPILRVRFSPDRGGTLIDGQIGVSRFAIIFMIIWFSFLVIFMLVASFMLVSTPNEAGASSGQPFAVLFLGVPVAMMLGGVAMIVIGRRIAAADIQKLHDFLVETTDAKPRTPQYKLY